MKKAGKIPIPKQVSSREVIGFSELLQVENKISQHIRVFLIEIY